MFALVIGGAIAGLVGAILALPITAATRDIFAHLFMRLSPQGSPLGAVSGPETSDRDGAPLAAAEPFFVPHPEPVAATVPGGSTAAGALGTPPPATVIGPHPAGPRP
jgi:hypothetical protein